jgi:hypothetical protein
MFANKTNARSSYQEVFRGNGKSIFLPGGSQRGIFLPDPNGISDREGGKRIMGMRIYVDDLEELLKEGGQWPPRGMSGKHIVFERPLWHLIMRAFGFTKYYGHEWRRAAR